MSYKIAIKAEKLSKTYKLFETPSQRILYYLFNIEKASDFKALENVSFEINAGETFAIVGRNGSGKSTLLQILAGIIKPTSGHIEVQGKVAALLELGSGFNPESTGLENIYMNAAILGVGRKEINRKMDAIIAFAEIGEFINQPVKTYSSGMYIRLAFAVAIHVDAEIILIDEALAVGDVFFRQKCYAKLNEMKKDGKTIILVTHSMGEVEEFCDRALLLNKGTPIMLGRSQDVVKQYYLINQNDTIPVSNDYDEDDTDPLVVSESSDLANWAIAEPIFFDLTLSNEIGNGKAIFRNVGLFDRSGHAARVFEQGESAYFYMEIEVLDDLLVPITGVAIYDQKNTIVYGKNSIQTYTTLPKSLKKGSVYIAIQQIDLALSLGEFSFEVGVSEIDYLSYKKRDLLPQEDLFRAEHRISHRNNVGVFSVILKKIGSPTRLTHHGISNLTTEFRVDSILPGGEQ